MGVGSLVFTLGPAFFASWAAALLWGLCIIILRVHSESTSLSDRTLDMLISRRRWRTYDTLIMLYYYWGTTCILNALGVWTLLHHCRFKM